MENAVIECLKSRRSIRSYQTDKMPSKKLIEKIVEAGEYAPSGRGMQSSIIIAVTDKETVDLLSKMNAKILGTSSNPFYGAPVVLIVLADRERSTYLYDGTLVMGNLLNAAHAVGLGSCWIHRAKEVFDSTEGKELLKKWGVTGNYEGIGHCLLGYATDDAQTIAQERKPDYVRYI